MECLFAHGFEGVPGGRKARFLSDVMGLDVIAPHMTRQGWTFEDQVGVLLAELDAHPRLQRVVGSSMGALAAAVAVARRPDRQLRLVLMAPAVGVHETWSRQLGEDGMKLWAEMGTLQYRHLGVDQEVQLPYRLWTQCHDAAGVVIRHPAVLVHGKHDDVIRVHDVVDLAVRSPGVQRLIVVDDGHRLLEHLPLMAEAFALLERR